MSLKHALLGFLNYQSMTGYQLKKHFDDSVGNFWNASLSQIYPTLNKMSAEGLLDVEMIHQDTVPNAKRYSITADGKRELIRWLKEPLEREAFRSQMLVRLFFSSNIERSQVLGQLHGLIKTSEQKLQICKNQKKHIEENHLPAGEMSEEALFWSLTADYGVKYEEFFRAWCEDSIRKIEAVGDNQKD